MGDYQPGDEIEGKYRIEQELGGGNMGTVYRATHKLMNRQVAIKILHSDIAANREYVARFQREAEAAAVLEHPNICTGMDFGQLESGDFYFVMEFLEGETLSSRIQRHALPSLAAVRIMRQLLKALRCASEHGVVHRDVKPDNIFLVKRNDCSDVVKLLDFGIAHCETTDGDKRTLTQAGLLYGTPQYISPEQVIGDGVIDGRADLYASGVVLYEMLMGKPPFYASNYIELLNMHLNKKPPHLEGDIEAKSELDVIIQKLMQKSASDRFQTADEALRAVNGVLLMLTDDPVERAEAEKSGTVFLGGIRAAAQQDIGEASASSLQPASDSAPASVVPQADSVSGSDGLRSETASGCGLRSETSSPGVVVPSESSEGIESVRSDIMAVLPKTKREKRGFAVIVLGAVLGVLVLIGVVAVLIISFGKPGGSVDWIDEETGTVIYEEARGIKKPQPFNYEEGFKISHDSELSKDQNVVSAAENLLDNNADQAVISLESVRGKYKKHPNFLRLYLLALYKVRKVDRDYEEIYRTLGRLLDIVPDAGRNPYVGELICDFVDSREHHEKMADVLSEHGDAVGIAQLIIRQPFDRNQERKKRLVEIYGRHVRQNAPEWLDAGVRIWSTEPRHCSERLKIFESVSEDDETFYENIVVPFKKFKCESGNFWNRRDCNDCLTAYFSKQDKIHSKSSKK